jgi:DNA-binding CsgD family transcriptional regulator
MRYEGQSIEQIAVRFGVSERRVEMTMGCSIKMLGQSLRRQKRKGW